MTPVWRHASVHDADGGVGSGTRVMGWCGPCGCTWHTSGYPPGTVTLVLKHQNGNFSGNIMKLSEISCFLWHFCWLRDIRLHRAYTGYTETTEKHENPVSKPVSKLVSGQSLSSKLIIFMIFLCFFMKFHDFLSFCVIERTNSCHGVTTDLIVTRLGNDAHF